MPLLMGCTQPSKIKTSENDIPVIYDPISQMVKLDFRVIGTKSLKNHATKLPTHQIKTDAKNEIDDQKNAR